MKKLWEKYAASIDLRIFKSLNWPEKNNFFERAMNKKLILYEQFAYIYNKIKKWI